MCALCRERSVERGESMLIAREGDVYSNDVCVRACVQQCVVGSRRRLAECGGVLL